MYSEGRGGAAVQSKVASSNPQGLSLDFLSFGASRAHFPVKEVLFVTREYCMYEVGCTLNRLQCQFSKDK